MVKIEDMEMPKSCWDCKFRYQTSQKSLYAYTIAECCFITKANVYGHGKTRAEDCPLKECK